MTATSRTIPARRDPIRTLWWCALAIALFTIAASWGRGHLSSDAERIFTKSWRPTYQGSDSWMPMKTAFDYLRSPHTTPVYTKVFLQDHVKFQYPLTSLLVLYVVKSRKVFNFIGLILILATCPLMVSLFNRFLDMAAPDRARGKRLDEPASDRIGRIVLPLAMMLTFYPLINTYRLGQLQAWLFAGFMLLVWLWIDKRYVAAGLLAGLLTCGKPQFGLLLIWAATRKKWSFCGGFLASALAIGAISVACFGLADNLNYLTVLSELSRHGESWWANQSINGILNRAFRNDISLDWWSYYLPRYIPMVYAGTMLSSLVLIAGALFVPAKLRGGIADLLLASFTCTVASPVAWLHHYSILVPVYAALFAWGAAIRPLGRWTMPVLCVSYCLVGTYLGAFWKLALTPLNFVQSYPFVGVAIALFLLYVWVVRGEPDGVTTPPHVTKGANADCTSHEALMPHAATV